VANTKSAIKRIEIAERNRLRNKSYTSAIKTLTKKCINAIEVCAARPGEETQQDVQRSVAAAFSKIDKAVKRGVLHPNNGARKKSRIARLLKKYLESYIPIEHEGTSEMVSASTITTEAGAAAQNPTVDAESEVELAAAANPSVNDSPVADASQAEPISSSGAEGNSEVSNTDLSETLVPESEAPVSEAPQGEVAVIESVEPESPREVATDS